MLNECSNLCLIRGCLSVDSQANTPGRKLGNKLFHPDFTQTISYYQSHMLTHMGNPNQLSKLEMVKKTQYVNYKKINFLSFPLTGSSHTSL